MKKLDMKKLKRTTRVRRAAPPLGSPSGPSMKKGHDDEDLCAPQRSVLPATMAFPSFALSSAFQAPSSQSTSKKRKRTDDDAAYVHTLPPPSATPTSSPLTPLSSDEPSLKDKGKKRQKNDGDSDNNVGDSNGGDNDGDDNGDSAYKDCHDINATSLVQQVMRHNLSQNNADIHFCRLGRKP